eukprot:scaffold8453_cov140-Isochrysis_galbana.AAC.1
MTEKDASTRVKGSFKRLPQSPDGTATHGEPRRGSAQGAELEARGQELRVERARLPDRRLWRGAARQEEVGGQGRWPAAGQPAGHVWELVDAGPPVAAGGVPGGAATPSPGPGGRRTRAAPDRGAPPRAARARASSNRGLHAGARGRRGGGGRGARAPRDGRARGGDAGG